MIDEIIKTIRLHLSERLTSPLFGAIVVSWVAWNHRAIIVVLSNESVLRKFAIIDAILYPTKWHSIFMCFLFPVMTALIYLFAYPYPAKYVYQFTRKKQREILDIRRKIEDETPLTIEDSKRLRNDLARAEQAYYSELDRKDTELEKLKNQILLLSQPPKISPIATQDAEIKTVKRQTVSVHMLEMLRQIEKANGTLPESNAVRQQHMSKVEAEFALGELQKHGLISREFDRTNNRYVFKFTHSGRAALLAAKSDEVPPDDA